MARPLTRIGKRTKKVFVRPPDIEAEINRLLTKGLAEATRCARVRDPSSPEFVRSESLVHLIREANRGGHDVDSRALLELLLERCKTMLDHKIRDNGVPNPEKLRELILQELALKFAEDAVEGGDWLDYYECKFNDAFRALRVDHYRKETKATNRLAPEVSEEAAEQPLPGSGNADIWRSTSVEDRLYLKQVLAALGTLPPDEREAVVMCRVWGLSQDEAAQRAGVADARTIRNRLTRADKKLAQIKEDR